MRQSKEEAIEELSQSMSKEVAEAMYQLMTPFSNLVKVTKSSESSVIKEEDAIMKMLANGMYKANTETNDKTEQDAQDLSEIKEKIAMKSKYTEYLEQLTNVVPKILGDEWYKACTDTNKKADRDAHIISELKRIDQQTKKMEQKMDELLSGLETSVTQPTSETSTLSEKEFLEEWDNVLGESHERPEAPLNPSERTEQYSHMMSNYLLFNERLKPSERFVEVWKNVCKDIMENKQTVEILTQNNIDYVVSRVFAGIEPTVPDMTNRSLRSLHRLLSDVERFVQVEGKGNVSLALYKVCAFNVANREWMEYKELRALKTEEQIEWLRAWRVVKNG